MQATRLFIVSIFLICVNFCIAQNDPPPAAEPTKENKLLIDSLIKLSSFEAYFTRQCVKGVSEYSKLNKWALDKEKKTLNSIDFKYFVSDIHNAFVEFSSEDLKNLLRLLKRFDENDEYNKPIILTRMIEINLESFIKDLVKGAYIKK